MIYRKNRTRRNRRLNRRTMKRSKRGGAFWKASSQKKKTLTSYPTRNYQENFERRQQLTENNIDKIQNFLKSSDEYKKATSDEKDEMVAELERYLISQH